MRFKTEIRFLLFILCCFPALSWSKGVVGSTQLSLSLDQYLNVTDSSTNNDQVISAQIKRGTTFIFGSQLFADTDLLWSGSEETLFYNINEMHLSFGRGETFLVGIHKEHWNSGLDFWGSSEWNPQMQRNKLRVQSGGLPGVFYKKPLGAVNFTAMYSPYFLPHQGPGYDFEGGAVKSASPWFLPPPDSVPYEGESFSTNYTLDKPNIADFLQAPAYAASLEWYAAKDVYVRMNWARKANPHILLDLNFTANATQPEVPIDVLVKPRIAEHELRSIETQWKMSERSSLSVSVLQEVFENENFNTHQFTYQVFQDQMLYSMIFNQERYNFDYSVGILIRDGGELGSVGELSTALVHQGVRHIYQRAIKTAVSLKNLWAWKAEGTLAYDWQQRGFIATLNLKRNINRNAYFELGVDAIEPMTHAPEESFIYQYRNLDRVWAGVGYVF